ncbi:MAG TPA: metallophosphoesterase [Myxococcales bacterium]|jgi:3',5'-cyclic AMP phosphodiesterase CpdA
MRVLHFSDPHVQLPRWRERKLRDLGPLRAIASAELWRGRGALYEGAVDALRAIVRDADRLRADWIICTGDLTQLAMEEEFALAREALLPIWGRLTCIPGNHDRYPFDDGSHNRLFEQYFHGLPLRPPDELSLFVLDSCGPVCWPIITRGHVPSAELAGLSERIEAARGCKLVLLHHSPLLRNGRPDFVWHALKDAHAVLRAAAPADAILCGHLHERFEIRATSRVFCAGSSTERGKEGYFVFELDGHIQSAQVRRPGA